MIKRIIRWSAENRVMVIAATLVALGFAWWSMRTIPLDALPEDAQGRRQEQDGDPAQARECFPGHQETDQGQHADDRMVAPGEVGRPVLHRGAEGQVVADPPGPAPHRPPTRSPPTPRRCVT